MAESVILIGGGGHAKVVMDCVVSAGDRVIGILDDSLAPGTDVLGIPVLGKTESWNKYQDCKFIISIGSNEVRRKIATKCMMPWYTAIHPAAIVSSFARIGAGTVVMPGVIVNAGAVVGCHCIINSGAVVEHDNVLADYVHISPAAALGGTVRIGAGSHVGIGAVVKNNIHICSDVIIGAGAAVVKDIAESGVYVGIPARRLK